MSIQILDIAVKKPNRYHGNSFVSSYYRKKRKFQAEGMDTNNRMVNPSQVTVPKAGKVRIKKGSS